MNSKDITMVRISLSRISRGVNRLSTPITRRVTAYLVFMDNDLSNRSMALGSERQNSKIDTNWRAL